MGARGFQRWGGLKELGNWCLESLGRGAKTVRVTRGSVKALGAKKERRIKKRGDAYCGSSGRVSQTHLAKVPAAARILTGSSLSSAGKRSCKELFDLASIKRGGCNSEGGRKGGGGRGA